VESKIRVCFEKVRRSNCDSSRRMHPELRRWLGAWPRCCSGEENSSLSERRQRADAQHLAAEFVNRFNGSSRAGGHRTHDGQFSPHEHRNDAGFDQVFSRQVEALARSGISWWPSAPVAIRSTSFARWRRPCARRDHGGLDGVGGSLARR